MTAVKRTRARVREALETWDAADPSACEAAGRLLEEARAEIGTVKDHIQAGGQLTSVDVTELTVLRLEVSRLTRRLDMSQAFLRGWNGFVSSIPAETGPAASLSA